MNSTVQSKRAILYHLALALVILGAGFLAWTTESLQSPLRLWPLATLWLGMAGGFMAMAGSRKLKHVFPAAALVGLSVVELLSLYLGLPLRDYWPLFVIAAGLSLGLSGWLSYRKLKAGYLVPALAFILLGGIFLIFSFGFSSMSFKVFIGRWWPTLFLAAGIVLFVAYFLMKALSQTSPKGGDGR